MAAARRGRRAIGLPGVVLVIVGAALSVVSFRLLDWYSVSQHLADRPNEITFAALRTSADQLDGAGTATLYFDWLAWVVLIAVIAAGVAANLPVPGSDGLRVLGFLLGLVGVAVTYFAIAQLHNAQVAAGASKHSVFYNSTWGMWAAFAGFALAAVGAGLGSRVARR